MHQAGTSLSGNADVDGQQSPDVKRLSGAGKRLTPNKKPGLWPKATPTRRFSLCADSRTSLSSSSSTNSTVFDIDSSPVGTPPTPPSPESGPNFSLRSRTANLKNGSTVSSKDEIPGEKSYFDAKPPSPSITRRGEAQHCSSLQFQEQDSQLDVPGIAEDISAALVSLRLDDSPTAKKQCRLKAREEKALRIGPIAKKLGSMSLRGNDIGRRNKTLGGEIGNVSLEPDLEAESSHMLDSDKDAFNGDENEASNAFMSEIERASKIMAGGAHQGVTLSSKIPPTRVAKSALKSKKSAKPRLTHHLDTGVSSVGEPQGQRRKGRRSSSVSLQASLSTRRRSPRLAGSTSDSRAREGHIIDRTTGYNSSVTSNRSSELMEQELAEQEFVEQEPDCSPTAAEFVNSSIIEDADTSIEQLQTTRGGNIRRNPPEAVLKFENFNEQKLPNDIRNKVLFTLRRANHEKKFTKNSNTPFILLLPRIVQKRWYPKHPVSTHDMSEGFIYIFRSKSKRYSGYFKIGRTERQPGTRCKEWENLCGFECIHIHDPEDKIFRHYKIVEQLIQAELWNERRKFKCANCGVCHKFDDREQKVIEHGEWYEITEKHALEVVQKWRRWIVERQPYMQHGVLRDFWKWKYEQANVGEVDLTTWCQFNWADIFHYGFYYIYTTIEKAAPALVAVWLGPGIIFLLFPIFVIYHSGTGIVVGVSGVTATICFIAFSFLFC
jgi:hypothetical protein